MIAEFVTKKGNFKEKYLNAFFGKQADIKWL